MVTPVYFAAFFLARNLKLEDRCRKTAMCETPSSAQSPTDDAELNENHKKVSFSTFPSPGVELDAEKTGEKTAREKEINELYRKKNRPVFTRTGKDWLKLGAFYKVTSLAITIFPTV